MENVNFYNVQIGTYTRKGNYLENIGFICQSENTQNEVLKYYSEKYAGFSVKVLPITEVINVSIPKKEVENTHSSSIKIKELESEINKLKSGERIHKLQLEISYKSISQKFYEKRTEYLDLLKRTDICKTELRDIIRENLQEKHKEYVRHIEITSPLSDTMVQYTVTLQGTLESILEEQIENLKTK